MSLLDFCYGRLVSSGSAGMVPDFPNFDIIAMGVKGVCMYVCRLLPAVGIFSFVVPLDDHPPPQ